MIHNFLWKAEQNEQQQGLHGQQWDLDAFCNITFTDNTSVLTMPTVVCSEASMSALAELCFIPSTCNVIHPDGSCALSKSCTCWCWDHPPTAQLSAHHLGINSAPAIVTDGAPLASVEDLHSARAGAFSINQTDLPFNPTIVCWWCGGPRGGKIGRHWWWWCCEDWCCKCSMSSNKNLH